MLEPTFSSAKQAWAIPTATPSLADISLYYQLRWGIDIAAGRGISNLSAGGAKDTDVDVTRDVFNERRYPGLWKWFHRFEEFVAGLPDLETVIERKDTAWKEKLEAVELLIGDKVLVPAAAEQHGSLDVQRGFVEGASVSVVPDDTGRGNPTVGILIKIGVEEVVIRPVEKAEIEVQVHFPRLGFLVRVVEGSKL